MSASFTSNSVSPVEPAEEFCERRIPVDRVEEPGPQLSALNKLGRDPPDRLMDLVSPEPISGWKVTTTSGDSERIRDLTLSSGLEPG